MSTAMFEVTPLAEGTWRVSDAGPGDLPARHWEVTLTGKRFTVYRVPCRGAMLDRRSAMFDAIIAAVKAA